MIKILQKTSGIILIILFIFSGTLFAQFNDIGESEIELAKSLTKIEYWFSYDKNEKEINKYDSLVKENTILTQKLYDLLKTNRNSLNYDFPSLKAGGINIVSSKDSSLRIFSWDTKTGGTMHMFNSILQYRYMNKISAKILNNVFENNGSGAGYYYPKIYIVRPYIYLVLDNAVYSTKDVYMGIRGFSIENGILNDTIGIFKTKQGLVNEVGTGYDFFSVVNVPVEKRPVITYDEEKQEVSIPMTDFENDLSGQYIKFLFNGTYFVKEMINDLYYRK